MNNQLLQIKIKERLNKLDSDDYENIPCWQIQEAFNKAQREWVRRQINGMNQRREGRESSSQEISDLQNLLTTFDSTFVNKGLYYESCDFPKDYLVFARVSAFAKNDCCPPRRLTIYQEEESDVDILLRSPVKRPDFLWAETFSTFFANKIRIYTDSKFELVEPKLIYYRAPVPVEFIGCSINIETGNPSSVDVECEFTNGVTELIIDDAAAILAGDIESQLQMQRNSQNEQKNN
jgi:hypothetical protein